MLFYNYFSGSTIAFFCSFFFPPVHSSVYFYPESPNFKPKLNYKTIDKESVEVNYLHLLRLLLN